MSINVEDTGMCICGHPKDKHRDNNLRSSCKKCSCKAYTPAVQTNDGLIAKEHDPDCGCSDCAWERLMNAERNLLSLKGEIERLDKSLDLEIDASTEMEERIDELSESIEVIQEEFNNSIKDLKAKIDEGNKIIVEHHNDNEAAIKDLVEYITSASYSRKKELIKKMNR